jgi:hypothetical protein
MQFRLAYRVALHSSFKDGKITQDQFDILHDALMRPIRKKRTGEKVDLLDEVENYAITNAPKTGEFFDNLIEWLKAHWMEILKLLLSLLPLFLAEPENKAAETE